MRNRHAASRFLDLVAGVDDEEEEEEEEDELDELEDDEDEEEADLRPPAPNTFDDHGEGDAAAELDEAFDALLKRSKQRGVEDRASLPPFDARAEYTRRDCATSVLRRQVDVPGPEDVPIYSIQVKKGKEQLLAFRLTNKALATSATDILSILALPKKAPGRIYVEARNGSASVRLLCSGMHFIYPSSIFMVPVAERVALLLHSQRTGRAPSIKRGDLVQIRNGLYKNDLGQVVDVSSGHGQDILIVKVKGREPDPRELKRKRSQNSIRREPSVYDKEELRRLHFFDGDFDFVDLGEDGFEFGGKRYTNDGYLLLKIRYDRVERLQRTSSQLSPHLSDDLGRTSNGVLTLKNSKTSCPPIIRTISMSASADFSHMVPIPKFIRPGVRVRITRGASAGAIARVVDVKSSSSSSSPTHSALALVQLQLVPLKHPQQQLQQKLTTAGAVSVPIKFDIELVHLTRAFEIGDHVEVKVGKMRGWVGMVSFVKGEMLHVVDSKELSEFKVLATFVDTYEPPFRQLAPVDQPNLRLGSPVKIIRGKNAGKTGRIVTIQRERECVTVLEDVTDIELVVRRDNVEPFVENVLTKPVYIPSRSPVSGSQVSERETVPQPKLNENEKARAASPTNTKSPSGTTASPTPPSSSKQHDSQTCSLGLNHLKHSFDNGQTVYAWRGPFKGRFGKCLHMSGLLAGVSLGSRAAFQGEGVTYVLRSCLVARCGCVLADGVKLPWTKEEVEDIPMMFDNWEKGVAEVARPKTPPSREIVLENETPASQFHDPTGLGMWIFHPKIAPIRKSYNLVVKIQSHYLSTVSGLREGRILSDPNAPSQPLPLSSPLPKVLVKYTSKRDKVEVVEPMNVGCLGLTSRMKDRATHVVMRGEYVGLLVTHLRSDGFMARVVQLGMPNKCGFYIEKKALCVVERSDLSQS